MTETATRILNKVAWVDLAAKDAAAARDFYGKVFGWTIEVNPDPQYGGYGRRAGRRQGRGRDRAGAVAGPADGVVGLHRDRRRRRAGKRVTDAGGTVIAPPFDVGDQGRMAVFQDPAGAFISAWQAHRMGGFQTEGRTRSAGRS